MLEVYKTVARVAATKSTVLILGESGRAAIDGESALASNHARKNLPSLWQAAWVGPSCLGRALTWERGDGA